MVNFIQGNRMDKVIGKSVEINNTSYLIVNPNNFINGCISLYNIDTGLYARHYNSKLIESDSTINSDSFQDDSSFYYEFDGNDIFLRCSNPKLSTKYISKNNCSELVIDNENKKNKFKIKKDKEFDDGSILYSDIYNKLTYFVNKLNELKSKYRLDVSAGKLRVLSRTIAKRNRVVFVGTGKLGENTQYAFMKFCDIVKKNHYNIEVRYFARNTIEKEYFDELGYPCEIWSSLIPEHIEYALLSKVAVFATHTFASDYSNTVLLSSLSGAFRIQLWHGFLAKTVGAATLSKIKDIVRISNVLEDTCVNVVTTAIDTMQVKSMYERCFPGAHIICTGDPRTDVLSVVENRLENNKLLKILISPTYRESKSSAIKYIESVARLIGTITIKNVNLSIKFHPIFFNRFTNDEKIKYLSNITDKGITVIGEREDSYKILNNYDAIISDYSSIRFDYMITGRPVILYRPDLSDYSKLRTINPLKEFDEIDNISYCIDESNVNQVLEKIADDPLCFKRRKLLDSLGLKRDGESSKRVSELILKFIDNPVSFENRYFFDAK